MSIYILKNNLFDISGKKSYEYLLFGKNSIDILLDKFPTAVVIDSISEITEDDSAVVVSSEFVCIEPSNLVQSNDKIHYLKCDLVFDDITKLPYVLDKIRRQILIKHLKNGVVLHSFDNIYIDSGVEIHSGVEVFPNNYIKGDSKICSGAVINPNCDIENSYVGENCVVTSSTMRNAKLGNNSTLGPNAYLRPKAVVGESCKIGDFVEIKNSVIGNRTKISHLAYVGDAEVGENCNIGCGVIFINYDGVNKHKTCVGNNCFIGSNCNLVAPINIGDTVFVSAGTTVTKDLHSGCMCIGRSRETIKENGAYKYIQKKE